MARRVGIYGGTFDPVHLGHVALVCELAERHELDLVLIIPAAVNPHKKPPTSAIHRLHMVQEAFSAVPNVQVLAIELERDGPSYTIDTVHELFEKGVLEKGDLLFLLMGQDQLQTLSSWKAPEELFQLAAPLIASRKIVPGSHELAPTLAQWVDKGMTETPLFDISATRIRERLKKGLFCGHLLNKHVYNYIEKHHLYE